MPGWGLVETVSRAELQIGARERQMTESMGSAELPFDRERFCRKHSVAELFANVEPLGQDEDLTDDEWHRFVAATND